MTIAVIIPCFNEENYIGLLLSDLAEQSFQPREIIVVDCHSGDKTVESARRFSKNLPLKILESPYRSAAAARNTGADAADSDYFLFLDADIRIKPNFIQELIQKTNFGATDFVTPRIKPEGHNLFDLLFYWSINLWVYLYRMKITRKISGVAGGAMLIKKSAHEAIGGYNPKMREFDDPDYVHRMQKHHLSYAFAWRAAAIHSNRRLASQGRFATFLQSLPDNYFLGRHVARPLMKKLGVKPKWHDLN